MIVNPRFCPLSPLLAPGAEHHIHLTLSYTSYFSLTYLMSQRLRRSTICLLSLALEARSQPPLLSDLCHGVRPSQQPAASSRCGNRLAASHAAGMAGPPGAAAAESGPLDNLKLSSALSPSPPPHTPLLTPSSSGAVRPASTVTTKAKAAPKAVRVHDSLAIVRAADGS